MRCRASGGGNCSFDSWIRSGSAGNRCRVNTFKRHWLAWHIEAEQVKNDVSGAGWAVDIGPQLKVGTTIAGHRDDRCVGNDLSRSEVDRRRYIGAAYGSCDQVAISTGHRNGNIHGNGTR